MFNTVRLAGPQNEHFPSECEMCEKPNYARRAQQQRAVAPRVGAQDDLLRMRDTLLPQVQEDPQEGSLVGPGCGAVADLGGGEPGGGADDASQGYYYVSCRPQPHQLRGLPKLKKLLDSVSLPCWLPHRKLADALGHSHSAIVAAESVCGGYCWASEFENVHELWPIREPGFVCAGMWFAGPEQFYQVGT